MSQPNVQDVSPVMILNTRNLRYNMIKESYDTSCLILKGRRFKRPKLLMDNMFHGNMNIIQFLMVIAVYLLCCIFDILMLLDELVRVVNERNNEVISDECQKWLDLGFSKKELLSLTPMSLILLDQQTLPLMFAESSKVMRVFILRHLYQNIPAYIEHFDLKIINTRNVSGRFYPMILNSNLIDIRFRFHQKVLVAFMSGTYHWSIDHDPSESEFYYCVAKLASSQVNVTSLGIKIKPFTSFMDKLYARQKPVDDVFRAQMEKGMLMKLGISIEQDIDRNSTGYLIRHCRLLVRLNERDYIYGLEIQVSDDKQETPVKEDHLNYEISRLSSISL